MNILSAAFLAALAATANPGSYPSSPAYTSSGSPVSWGDGSPESGEHRAGHACGVYPVPDSPLDSVDYPDEPIVLDHEINILGNRNSKSLVVLPAVDDRAAPGRFPLVMLLHGRTYEYTEYTAIQKRLAANGIASVSIQYSQYHNDSDYYDTELYEVFEKTLNSIYNPSPYDESPLHGKVTKDVSIIGHSMGGGLAVYAANRLVEEGKYGLTVRSVISLAPNPHAEFEWNLRPDVTQGLLVLFGSDDEDDGVNTPGNSGFYLYDQSGYLQNEFSDFYPAHAFVKSMVYMKGAGHDAFLDSGPDSALATAAGYIVAFSRWSLLDDGAYAVYFKQQVPLGTETTVSTLYSSPYRRVLDNFEDKTAAWNQLGGKNTFSHVTAEQDFSLFEHDSPHYTQVLGLRWKKGQGKPIASFAIPMPMKGFTDYRDLSRFAYVSFRAGQMYEPAANNNDLDFRIRLDYFANGVHASQTKLLSDFGSLPFPFAHKQASGTKSVMNTVMIPLCAYDEIDFEKALITNISFEFLVPGSESGEIQMDSLEFIP